MADTKTLVKDKYGAAARSVQSGAVACCDPGLSCCDPITKDLYADSEKQTLPKNAVLASLGCGNPTALIDLQHDLWGCVGGCALLVLGVLVLVGYLVWHFL